MGEEDGEFHEAIARAGEGVTRTMLALLAVDEKSDELLYDSTLAVEGLLVALHTLLARRRPVAAVSRVRIRIVAPAPMDDDDASDEDITRLEVALKDLADEWRSAVGLTKRETEVFLDGLRGKPRAHTAAKLGIGIDTVNEHGKEALSKTRREGLDETRLDDVLKRELRAALMRALRSVTTEDDDGR